MLKQVLQKQILNNANSVLLDILSLILYLNMQNYIIEGKKPC